MQRYILILEDDKTQMRNYERAWRETTTDIGVFRANDLVAAQEYYDIYKSEIVGMIIDGAVPGGFLTTIPFIQTVRADGFSGFMVAASTREDYRKTMVQYGCTYECEKRHAVKALASLLDL